MIYHKSEGDSGNLLIESEVYRIWPAASRDKLSTVNHKSPESSSHLYYTELYILYRLWFRKKEEKHAKFSGLQKYLILMLAERR